MDSITTPTTASLVTLAGGEPRISRTTIAQHTYTEQSAHRAAHPHQRK